MEFHFSRPNAHATHGGSQHSSQSSTSLYMPNSQPFESNSQAASYFSPPYLTHEDPSSQLLPSSSQVPSSLPFANATQTTVPVSAPPASQPASSRHQSLFDSKPTQYSHHNAQRDGPLGNSLVSSQPRPARSYVAPSRPAAKKSSIMSGLQGSPRMLEMERTTAQSLQESAALHSMLDGTREAIARLHQLYTDGFSAIKEQIASILHNQAQNSVPIDYTSSLRSQTSQLSTIVSELDQIKANIDKGAKATQKEGGKDVAKLDEVLSLLSTIESKFDAVEETVAKTSTTLTKALVPEHKKLSKEINSRFDDITSSIQEIVEEAMKPLSDSVYKALRRKDEESRQSATRPPVATSTNDSTANGPVHSSVTLDTLFEDKIERMNRSITTDSTQSTVQRKDHLDDWFATFLQRMGSQTASTTSISSQTLNASQPAPSWFESMDEDDPIPSQALSDVPPTPIIVPPTPIEVSPTPIAAMPSLQPPKRRPKARHCEAIDLSQSQEEGTYWDLSQLEPRKRVPLSPFYLSTHKKATGGSARAKKGSPCRYSLRSTSKHDRPNDGNLGASQALNAKGASSSIKAQRQSAVARRAKK